MCGLFYRKGYLFMLKIEGVTQRMVKAPMNERLQQICMVMSHDYLCKEVSYKGGYSYCVGWEEV
jgi:hypothetical protein